MIKPGYHCCVFNYKNHVQITKNSLRFTTPISRCPTKDNVEVQVDVGLTFHVGSSENMEDDCYKFLYYLGPNMLEELLQKELEESIRNLIRGMKVYLIRDLKSEITLNMCEELNQKFNKLGVYIERLDIMNIIIPKDLRVVQAETSTYDVMLQKQLKFQENLRLKIIYEEEIAMLQL